MDAIDERTNEAELARVRVEALVIAHKRIYALEKQVETVRAVTDAARAVRTGPDLAVAQVGVVRVKVGLKDWQALAAALDELDGIGEKPRVLDVTCYDPDEAVAAIRAAGDERKVEDKVDWPDPPEWVRDAGRNAGAEKEGE